MPKRPLNRVCLDPHTIRDLHREGLSWGFDLDCGCTYTDQPLHRGGLVSRLVRLARGG